MTYHKRIRREPLQEWEKEFIKLNCSTMIRKEIANRLKMKISLLDSFLRKNNLQCKKEIEPKPETLKRYEATKRREERIKLDLFEKPIRPEQDEYFRIENYKYDTMFI